MTRPGLPLAALALAWAAACSPEPASDASTAADLLALHPTGRAGAESAVIALRSSGRTLHHDEGWSGPLRHRQRNLVAAIAKEASFEFTIVSTARKRLEFGITLSGPQPAPQSQEISILLGDHLLTKLTLDATADLPVHLDLPEKLLVRGENRIVFRFAEIVENPEFTTGVVGNLAFPRVAAYFGSFRLVDTGGQETPRASGPAWQYSPEEATLRQNGPSFVEHAFRLVKGASLDVGGFAEGEGRPVDIEFRSEKSPRWRRLGFVGGTFQQRFPLKVAGGEIGQIRLTVAEGACTWNAIRLNGIAVEPRYEYVDRPAPAFRHVILIVLDALRSDLLAAGGERTDLMPHLNRLANQAVVFDQATSAASLTPSSMYAYFTGENPSSQALTPDLENASDPGPLMQGACFDLPAAFSAAGYRTVNIYANPYCRADYGLTASFGEEHLIWPDVPADDDSPRTSEMDQGPVLKLIDEMAASEVPTMLYLHYLPPHLPYNPPEAFRGFLTGDAASRVAQFPSRLSWLHEYGLADAADPQVRAVFDQYKENARYADALVGEVHAALVRRGLGEKTLVIVIADHGEAFFEHGRFKHSSTVFDEMIRVPLMFIHPSLRPGTVSQHVGLIDLPPTLVELFDLRCDGNRFAGRSLWPLLMGAAAPREDRWYFAVAGEGGTHFGYRTGTHKYICAATQDRLYELASDPGELRSVHEAHPLLTAWLWQKGQVDIFRSSQQQPARSGDGVDENRLRNLRDLGYIR